MVVWQYVFWLSIFMIFYNYAGYAIIAVLITRLRPKPKSSTISLPHYPSVSFIVAAYNEAYCIEEKVLNSLQLEYPGEIEFIFVTDGSTDKTDEIIARYPVIRRLHDPKRMGKSAAINRAVVFAKNDILIFSDSNTILNKDAVTRITQHYQKPETGGVAGEKKVLPVSGTQGTEVGTGEGLYWKYESVLKKIDSDFYSVVGAAGELFSLRRQLYDFIESNIILDDFVISMKVAGKGYRVIYEPDAYAMELPSFSLEEEQKRKIRIAAGGFQAIKVLNSMLFFWRHFKLSFLYISHRVLRWTVTPVCLILGLISNIVLCLFLPSPLYIVLMIGQLIFYILAFTASVIPFNGWLKVLKLPNYFVFMNISVIKGFFRFLNGSQTAVWEKAKRSEAA